MISVLESLCMFISDYESVDISDDFDIDVIEVECSGYGDHMLYMWILVVYFEMILELSGKTC